MLLVLNVRTPGVDAGDLEMACQRLGLDLKKMEVHAIEGHAMAPRWYRLHVEVPEHLLEKGGKK